MHFIPLTVNAGALWGKAWPLLVAVLYFGFLILSHELGHFSAARAFHVQVDEFSIGMGPRLLKLKNRKSGTLYSLKAVPFGGSVLMGEDEEATGANPHAFNSQKAWKRCCILAAGALVNLVCGVVIMGVIVGMSPNIFTTRVRAFAEDASTQAQGLQAGDVITKVNGKRLYSLVDLEFLVSRAKGRVDLTVKRGRGQVKRPGFRFPMTQEGDVQQLDYDFGLVFYSTNSEYANASGRPGQIGRAHV
jgi:regulator of sigma E protease